MPRTPGQKRTLGPTTRTVELAHVRLRIVYGRKGVTYSLTGDKELADSVERETVAGEIAVALRIDHERAYQYAWVMKGVNS